MSALGFPVGNLDDFAFLAGDAPATVNPSLWRQVQLNMHAGLFEVGDGFYQVRGLDDIAVRLDGGAAAGKVIELTLRISDRDEVHAVGIRAGALHHASGRSATRADATLALPHAALLALAKGTSTLADLEAAGDVRIEGDRTAFEDLLALLDTFTFWFAIAEP